MSLFRKQREVPIRVEEKGEAPSEVMEKYKGQLKEIGSNIIEEDLAAFKEDDWFEADDRFNDLRNKAYKDFKENYGAEKFPEELEVAFKEKQDDLRRSKKQIGEQFKKLRGFILASPEEREKMSPTDFHKWELEERTSKLMKMKWEISGDKDVDEEEKEKLLADIKNAKVDVRKQYQELIQREEEEKRAAREGIEEEEKRAAREKIEALRREISAIGEEPGEREEKEKE